MELKIEGVSRICSNGVRALGDVCLAIPAGTYGPRAQPEAAA